MNEVWFLLPDETREVMQEPRIGKRAMPWPVQKVKIDGRIKPRSKMCVAPARDAKDDRHVPCDAARE